MPEIRLTDCFYKCFNQTCKLGMEMMKNESNYRAIKNSENGIV